MQSGGGKSHKEEAGMLSITPTDEWRNAFPGGAVGLLELTGAANDLSSSGLENRKRETEALLRERYRGFTRKDFLSLPVMAAYGQYYKRFNKTYHVQLQLESIVLKGKNLPSVSPLVDANFAAEVETLVLTAAHDAAQLREPVCVDASAQGDAMTRMDGSTKLIYADDMVMKDAGGICCSIIYGQDNRSPVTINTSHVLYVAYAPAGVPAESVEAQLRKIEENVRLFSASVLVEQCSILTAKAG
jgi:DNA/RNA-binding domain of Phe-tRNA-synthetase-like protein